MTQYKYGTILEAQDDGQPPNDNIEEGDLIIKAGKHEADSLEYMGSDGDLLAVEFEAVAVYESNTRMSEREAQSFARDRWAKEHG